MKKIAFLLVTLHLSITYIYAQTENNITRYLRVEQGNTISKVVIDNNVPYFIRTELDKDNQFSVNVYKGDESNHEEALIAKYPENTKIYLKEFMMEQRKDDFDFFTNITETILENDHPTQEMFLNKINDIRNLESVEDAYVTDYEFIITTVNGPTFVYPFETLPSIFDDDEGLIETLSNTNSEPNISLRAENASIRIAVFNYFSNDNSRKNQNYLVDNTVSMLRSQGCTVDYYLHEQCASKNYNDALFGNYNAVYISTDGCYLQDKGYAFINTSEYYDKGIFGQVWGNGMTQQQVDYEEFIGTTFIRADGLFSNRYYKAYPLSNIAGYNAHLNGKLVYLASCESTMSKASNFWAESSGSIVGWNGKNVVGQAVGSILFYRMIVGHESLVGWANHFYGWKDPETNAEVQIKGIQNFKFVSSDSDNPFMSNGAVITQPLNGQYIKTTNNMVAFTIKGTYDTNMTVMSNPFLLATNSKSEVLDRIYITVKDGKFSKTFYFYEAFGVVNFSPHITFDLFPPITSVVFSGKFKENYALVPDEEEEDTSTLSVSQSSLTFPASGGTQTFTITSNTEWTIINIAPYLTISPLSGVNNGTVTVTAEPNTEASTRGAIIRIFVSDEPVQAISVIQQSTDNT